MVDRELGDQRQPHVARLAESVEQDDRRTGAGLEVVQSHAVDRGEAAMHRLRQERGRREDRKSTRLNSSHLVISYAVFCLKKKKNLIRRLVPPFYRTPVLRDMARRATLLFLLLSATSFCAIDALAAFYKSSYCQPCNTSDD